MTLEIFHSIEWILHKLLTGLWGLLWIASAPAAESACLDCHSEPPQGLQAAHRVACTACHAGNPEARTTQQAHAGLIRFPGNLSNAQQTCGACHPHWTDSLSENRMHRLTGMVQTTREVFDEAAQGGHVGALSHSPADTLLRKLCVGCHLGREKQVRSTDTRLRGGGCLACHLQSYPEKGHIRLSRQVGNDRCFGCHSRSGRISLNYAGLAEVESDTEPPRNPNQLEHLADGRLVERRAADVHHQAGMSCIDCHLGITLMGERRGDRRSGVRIRCEDCHHRALAESVDPSTAATKDPNKLLDHVRRMPAPDTNQPPRWIVKRKVQSGSLRIPQYRPESHLNAQEHARLSCDACHAQWAPQCYGCHLRYEPSLEQRDHLTGAMTAGRWQHRRWDIVNDLPPLGVDGQDRIRPFVPGMILTIEHPDWEEAKFKRLFAPLVAHTIGPARSCESCHCSPVALGLGEGKVTQKANRLQFEPAHPLLADGLPSDAWTHLSSPPMTSQSTEQGARPFRSQELLRIWNAGGLCE